MQGSGLSGAVAAVTAGGSVPEGEPGSPRNAAVLTDPDSHLVIDLGAVNEIRALVFQLDADDVYMIQGSTDGTTWKGLVRVEAGAAGAGLRTRRLILPAPEPVRFLGVHSEGGVGGRYVARLQAYPDVPPGFEEESIPQSAAEGPPWDDALVAAKGALAAAGAALLAWEIALRRRGRAASGRRLRDTLLAALGLAGLAAWWNFGRFHDGTYAHGWDAFHYFLGAKYQPELGYTRLYACAITADADQRGSPPGAPVLVRDLRTNTLRRTTVEEARADCGGALAGERKRAFAADVVWFRDHVPPANWQRMLWDHGYNATPAWEILGGLLARTGPASAERLLALTAIDSLLLLAMWALVARAFGWRAAAIAALFWGAFYPSRYWWNGGAFLRMDWLLCLVAGVCLLKRGRPRPAGALLALSALLRIFPGVVLLGLGLATAARSVRERRLAVRDEEKQLALGALAALVIALPLSLLAAGGFTSFRWSAWSEFAANSRKHLATPLTNAMGLKTVLSYRPSLRAAVLKREEAVDPYGRWKDARRGTAARMRVPYAVLAGLALAAFARLTRDEPAWIAAAAAALLIPVTTELTCYYMSALLLAALLARERAGIGVAALAFAALSCVAPFLSSGDEDRYALLSALTLAFGAAVLALLATRPPDVTARGREASAPERPDPAGRRRVPARVSPGVRSAPGRRRRDG